MENPTHPCEALSPKKVQSLKTECLNFAFTHAIVMGCTANPDALVGHAPITLLPTFYPKECFELGLEVQQYYNLLIHRMANDYDFLVEALESTGKADPEFTGKLLEIYKEVHAEGLKQTLELGLHRSDYMLHEAGEKPIIQQVEFNTISAAFSSLSPATTQMHKYVLATNKVEGYDAKNIPDNKCGSSLPATIALALKHYCQATNTKAVVMMVVQEGERNAFDQRGIEYGLWQNDNVQTIRRTLMDIHERAVLDPDTGALSIDGFNVGVVYFRAGYTPRDYQNGDKEWQARAKLERSLAIKCPSVAYHLCGTKKIQQIYSTPGFLERFFDKNTEQKMITKLQSTFTNIWSLGKGDKDKEIIKRAVEDPNSFVVKPQREGGGNNIYGEDVSRVLQNFSEEELDGYILMQLIKPDPFPSIILRGGKANDVIAISELGIYGGFISDGENIIFNSVLGHLLRTKVHTDTEGGVCAGVSALDSPLLY